MLERKKKRTNLDVLDPLDQELVFSHCNTAPVTLVKGCEWIKRTYNIETSPTRLSAWLQNQRAEKSEGARLQQIREESAKATLIGKVLAVALDLNEVNSRMIQQAVFQELQKEPEERNEKRLVAYMDLAIKSRAQEVKEKTVALQARRLYFNASKEALKCAAELQEINKGDGDEMEKIEKAMVVLFGEDPEGFESSPQSEIQKPKPEEGA